MLNGANHMTEPNVEPFGQRADEGAEAIDDDAVAVAIDFVPVVPPAEGEGAFVRRTVVARGQRDVPGHRSPVLVAQPTLGDNAPERILDRDVVVAIELAP